MASYVMREVIKKLNEQFPNGINSVDEVIEYKLKIEQRKKELIDAFKRSHNDQQSFTKILECSEKLEKFSDQFDTFSNEYSRYSEEVEPMVEKVIEKVDKIQTMDKCYKYLSLLDYVNTISLNIQAHISEKFERKVATEYKKLCTLYEALENGSNCKHFLKYLYDTVLYWHEILKSNYTKDFEEILSALKWPFMGNSEPAVPSDDILAKFQSFVELFFFIDLPEGMKEERGFCLPVVLLVQPLRKRFLYHFSGSRQTNQLEKPEWYFTQVLTWIRDHQEFLVKNVQPVFNCLKVPSKAQVEFINCLIELVREKLEQTLPEIQYDDIIFSHTIDETLGFLRELESSFGFEGLKLLKCLTQNNIFTKWLHLEKTSICAIENTDDHICYVFEKTIVTTYKTPCNITNNIRINTQIDSIEKLDSVMQSETAFKLIVSSDSDSNSCTECVDRFTTLLSTLTDRYLCLPQPGHQLQFLELQLFLIDDFRVRLLQIIRQEDDRDLLNTAIPHVLNSVHSLVEILEEWGVTPHFLKLHYFKTQINQTEQPEGTVFDEICDILLKMRDDLLKRVADSVFINVKAKSLPYRKDRWQAMDLHDGITPSGSAMFRILTLQLLLLHRLLTHILLQKAIYLIAHDLDRFFYEELILMVVFSPNGAKQLDYDISKSLIPLFSQYIDHPDVHFKLLKDSCIVLNLAKGPALLLQSALKSDPTVLNDLGVYSLTPKEVHQLLLKRTDLLMEKFE